MALSNRDRIGQMLELVAGALDAYITQAVAPVLSQIAPGAEVDWTKIVEARDEKRGGSASGVYDRGDLSLQLRMLADNVAHQVKPGWKPFDGKLSRAQIGYATELRDTRNEWAHMKSFSDDDAYRALDTAERLLNAIGAPDVAGQVSRIRLNLRRVSADRDDRRVLKAAVDNPDSQGLRPWREVLQPHEDVATGNFHASEFAADLFKVASGDAEQSRDYSDPTEFFRKTYLTEGLRDLIGRAVRRMSGDDNAAPVINLQTNFGGGKTHSMLSLWHIAAGRPMGEYPQEVQELLGESGYSGAKVNRVAIVGNHLSTSGDSKPDGTRVNTIWGELAWQLGGAEAYAIVADADRTSTPPGAALHDLLAAYSPAVILIDEWVAYARTLVGRDDLAAGTFDDQFTFAQALTEAVKGTSGVLLAISIPASESGDDSVVAGNVEEVGGRHGVEALERLQNVVRRVAQQWRPASSDEAYHIVRQRLFVTPDAAALAAIGATARGFVEMYRKYDADFPREARDQAYEDRIKQTYPIHPELFDRLYEDWSSLERFQRTRGVLRLMNTVIHALWVGEDASPMILPGSIPLSTSEVNTELTQYLQDSWKSIIDADVDGANSEPAKIDKERSLFGQRSLTKRLARTVFFGAVPTIGSAQKGLEAKRVFLGTAMPGDQPGNFHAALAQLGDRATYFYAGSGKYWYDLQANITRRAKDQAERLHVEDVWAEIVRRLQGQGKVRGEFAAVHVCPESNADIPDGEDVRLVVLHPKVSHKKGAASDALDFARQATEHRGSAARAHRNQIVFLAADRDRLGELETAVRDYLGWTHVLENADELDLTQNQKNQAVTRRDQAGTTTEARLLQSFVWALVPAQPQAAQPFVVDPVKVEGQAPSLAERVSKRMGSDGSLYSQQAASLIRSAIDRVPNVWRDGHVALGELWKLYTTFAYMPRLRDRSVLAAGLGHQSLAWQADGFALAESYDASAERYVGLWCYGDTSDLPVATDSLLLVKPTVAESQRAAEAAARADSSATDTEATPPDGDPRDRFVETEPGVHRVKVKTRFFGSTQVRPDRYAVDLRTISEELLAHFGGEGIDLTVRIDIEATARDGFDESTVRTVSENAATLKFEQSGFEED